MCTAHSLPRKGIADESRRNELKAAVMRVDARQARDDIGDCAARRPNRAEIRARKR